MALNDQRNKLVSYVAALARDRPIELMAFRLDDEVLAAAYDYLDPDLPCFIRSEQVRESVVEGCIARLRHRLFSDPLPSQTH